MITLDKRSLLAAVMLALAVGCAPQSQTNNPSSSPESEVIPESTPTTESTAAPRSPPDPSIRRSSNSPTVASRLFAGPGQYPPLDFKAYGILAFPKPVEPATRDRYLAICEGFLNSIPASASLTRRGITRGQQMVTVWPLVSQTDASAVNPLIEMGGQTNSLSSDMLCNIAVSKIDVAQSRSAIVEAEYSIGKKLSDGDGPFLIAWSPASTVGQSNVPILFMDLSNEDTLEDAELSFKDWKDRIELRPELWQDGWASEPLNANLLLLIEEKKQRGDRKGAPITFVASASRHN